jgi:hypothetical protein
MKLEITLQSIDPRSFDISSARSYTVHQEVDRTESRVLEHCDIPEPAFYKYRKTPQVHFTTEYVLIGK